MEAPSIERALRNLLDADARIRWAYVFGSMARGEHFRDVDVAVMPVVELPALELGRLRLELSRVAGTEVDLVDLGHASLPLLGSIFRDRRVLVDHAPEDRPAWEATMLSRWLDFEPAWRMQSEVRREALRRQREERG